MPVMFFSSDDGFASTTSLDQCDCEKKVIRYLNSWHKAIAGTSLSRDHNAPAATTSILANDDNEIKLLKEQHISYLTDALNTQLPSGFVTLDSSKPWILYWIGHALSLLGHTLNSETSSRIVNTLAHMQSPHGGFCGGSGQIAHCAPTYAAVLCLCTIGTEEALAIIDRSTLYNFFMRMKDKKNCGFRMHEDGEIDTRGTYTVLSVSRILNIITPELIQGVGEYILSCQTYEGGFGGEPGNEAHGGYNFCSLAGLLIIGDINQCNLPAQERWLQRRQMRLEGGFQGRTNKLVDSCYSFWQGAAFAIVNICKSGGNDFEEVRRKNISPNNVDEINFIQPAIDDTCGELTYNQKALQKYILHCAQHYGDGASGGMRDKPGKSRDFYHSCYALSGLSVAQNFNIKSSANDFMSTGSSVVYGDSSNLLEETSAVFNITIGKLVNAVNYFHIKKN